jgi:hypothetical protein
MRSPRQERLHESTAAIPGANLGEIRAEFGKKQMLMYSHLDTYTCGNTLRERLGGEVRI